MRTNCFSITKTLRIYLYGYNAISKRLIVQLKQGGYYAEGIIDRYAGMYKNECSFPVLTMEQLCEKTVDKEQVAVVICIRNAMQHRQIVESLLECGFSNLLYIPMEDCGGQDVLRDIMCAYEAFLEGDFESVNGIPKTLSIYGDTHKNSDARLIYDDGERVTFFCDIEDIFIGDEEWFSKRSPYVLEVEDFLFDVPVIHSYQHRELFGYYMGKVDEPVSCFNVSMKNNTDGWERYKKDRVELWNLFTEWLRQGMHMFSIHACPVCRNKNGYFYLADGGHRILYLYYHNIFKIPVRASKEDYRAYLLYVKSQKYIYKSTELLLQEHLFDKVDVINKTGLLIGDSETNRFFEKCSRKIYYLKHNREVSEICNEVDYIFYGDSDIGFDKEMWRDLLNSKCRRIFYESERNVDGYEMGLSGDWCMEIIASAVQFNMKTTKIYCLCRKEN